MCGRYSLTRESVKVQTLFGVDNVTQLAPRYNIAPTQPVGAVIENRDTRQRQWRHLHWGLVPSWAKDAKIGSRMINARSETVTQKPAYRAAIKYRRCLIPADGFYEWQRDGRRKQPYYITLADESLFAFAGLWEHWQSEHGDDLESCAILTTEPNDMMRPIHDRMPVIIEPDNYASWLDTKVQDPTKVTSLLRPLPAELMLARPVSAYVNNPRNDGPECITAAVPPENHSQRFGTSF